MFLGVDLSSNNPTFDFHLAQSQGCRTAYIKEGGDNIPRYISGSYAARVDAAKSMGWPVGSYWITGGHDPAAAADFAASHLEAFGSADYIVLDNETLDSGNSYTDAEAAAWVAEVLKHVGGNPARIVHYGSKSFMASHGWPLLLATGCSFLIADYNGTPLQNHVPATIPASRVVGHQYADNGNIGGASVDVNAFVDGFLTTISTASAGAQPITNRTYEEQTMNIYRAHTPSTDGRIGNGYIYVQDAAGPLRAVDNSEGSVILAKEAKGLVFIADWNGDDIRSLITRVGILEYGPMPAGLKMTTGTPLQGPGKLTGRVIYDNSTLPDFPKVTVA